MQVPPRRSSRAIASNLQKLQDLYLNEEIKYLTYEPSRYGSGNQLPFVHGISCQIWIKTKV